MTRWKANYAAFKINLCVRAIGRNKTKQKNRRKNDAMIMMKLEEDEMEKSSFNSSPKTSRKKK